jgi:hypothetical protein
MMDEGSLDHSSRMMDLNNKGEGGLLMSLEDEGKSTIYHVPSFLLKTYEIVDVINLPLNSFINRTRNMIPLFHGRLMANPSSSKNKMNSQKQYSHASSNTITSHPLSDS